MTTRILVRVVVAIMRRAMITFMVTSEVGVVQVLYCGLLERYLLRDGGYWVLRVSDKVPGYPFERFA